MNATEPKAQPPRISPKIALLAPSRVTLTVIHGNKSTCLALSHPRGRHFETVVGYDLSVVGRDQLLTAMLDWRYVEDELPDADTTVLIALDGDTDEPAFGFLDGDGWRLQDATLIQAPFRVYAWAHVPGLPPKKGVTS